MSTLFPFNNPSTPPANLLTTPSLNSCTFEKSTVTFSALIPYALNVLLFHSDDLQK